MDRDFFCLLIAGTHPRQGSIRTKSIAVLLQSARIHYHQLKLRIILLAVHPWSSETRPGRCRIIDYLSPTVSGDQGPTAGNNPTIFIAGIRAIRDDDLSRPGRLSIASRESHGFQYVRSLVWIRFYGQGFADGEGATLLFLQAARLITEISMRQSEPSAERIEVGGFNAFSGPVRVA